MQDVTDYLLECFKSARDELLFRVKHRDEWLKLALLTQVVIWGLASGVKVAGVEAARPIVDIQLLALPAALVLAGLYYVEDGLIHRLSKYLQHLPVTELSAKTPRFTNWDASTQLGNYARGVTLVLRTTAQVSAFLALPSILVSPVWLKIAPGMRVLQTAIAFTIVAVIIGGYVQRRQTGSPDDRRKRKGRNRTIADESEAG